MEERLASLTPDQRARLTDTERDYHQRAASSRATRELRQRARRIRGDAARSDAVRQAEWLEYVAKWEASQKQRQVEQRHNLEQLRAVLSRLPADCKESPPAHYRRYKPRGLTCGFVQFCETCDRVACRVHDGSRNRGGFRCQHVNKNYLFTMLEMADRTFLFLPTEPGDLSRPHFPLGESPARPLLVAWIQREQLKELPWFEPSGMTEEVLRERLADLLVR